MVPSLFVATAIGLTMRVSFPPAVRLTSAPQKPSFIDRSFGLENSPTYAIRGVSGASGQTLSTVSKGSDSMYGAHPLIPSKHRQPRRNHFSEFDFTGRTWHSQQAQATEA
jgi:hypothetical protein